MKDLLTMTSAWQSLTTRPWSLRYSPLIHLVPDERAMTCACLRSKPVKIETHKIVTFPFIRKRKNKKIFEVAIKGENLLV